LSSGKDFVVHNAVEAILAVPRPRGRDVDDWLAKPDYGKIPEYLSVVKSHIAAEHEFVQRMLDQRQVRDLTSGRGVCKCVCAVCESPAATALAAAAPLQMEEEAAAGTATRELSQEERDRLLDDLKSKWAEVNKAYQTITFRNISTHNSTLGEIRFKESCEQQMDTLERDIKRLSVKAPIFVVDG
jgi:hypothetical protein